MSVIGLDAGTSRVKAVRFGADWTEADSAAEDTTVIQGADGRSEQDMAQVWAACARVIALVAGRSPDAIDLVAITAQGDGCWLVDHAGEPVGPALLWNDNRAAGVVAEWQRSGVLDAVFGICGSYGAPGLASAQLNWMRHHEPARIDQAARLLSCGSWVYQNLTGQQVLEVSEAVNPFLDAATMRYDDRLLELTDLLDLRRLLPPVVTGESRLAPMTAGAAAATGLPAGTPVALAPYDVVSTAIGVGAIEADDAFGVLGTTLCVGTVGDDPRVDRPANGMSLPMTVPGRWLIAYATMSGTQILDWTATLLGLPDAAAVIELGVTSSSTHLPTVLPYFSPAGERSPFLDPSIRGHIAGLDLGHTRADFAQGVLVGLSLTVRDCVEAGGRPANLRIAGGGGRSGPWCDLLAELLGVPVVQPDASEVGARGAALVGATDAGHFGSLADAYRHAATDGVVHQPARSPATPSAEIRDRFERLRETVRAAGA